MSRSHWRDSKAVMPRPAKPFRPVRLRLAPPIPSFTPSKQVQYVIDHIKPLACGGLDTSKNMQWQTVKDAKAKDRWERISC